MKKIGVSSRNEVKILKATLNLIKIHVSSMESGTNTDISKVQIAIQDLMTFKIEEYDLYHFGNELQTEMVPALEGMLVNIQQLELNQVSILGFINPITTPPRTRFVSGLKGLEDRVNGDLISLSVKIDSK